MIPDKKFNKKYFTSGYYKNYKEILAGWVRPIAKRIYRMLENKKPAKILDVGCGFGDLLAELQNKYNFSVRGIEYSPYAIKKSRLSVRKKIRKGNILKLPFNKNSFDAVICFDVVPHLNLEGTTRAIKNLIKVSKKYIFFSSVYRHSIWASQKLNPDKLRISALSQKEYIDLFLKNGARFVKKFYGENSGDVLIFKKN